MGIHELYNSKFDHIVLILKYIWFGEYRNVDKCRIVNQTATQYGLIHFGVKLSALDDNAKACLTTNAMCVATKCRASILPINDAIIILLSSGFNLNLNLIYKKSQIINNQISICDIQCIKFM